MLDAVGAPRLCEPATAPDYEILALFRHWVATMRVDVGLNDDPAARDAASEAACEAACNARDHLLDEIEDRIATIQASGVSGLACKLHILLRRTDTNLNHDPAALSGSFNDFPANPGFVLSLVRDAARLMPEIASLVPDDP